MAFELTDARSSSYDRSPVRVTTETATALFGRTPSRGSVSRGTCSDPCSRTLGYFSRLIGVVKLAEFSKSHHVLKYESELSLLVKNVVKTNNVCVTKSSEK